MFYTDEEITDKLRDAVRAVGESQVRWVGQPPEEALAALGFNVDQLGAETYLKPTAKTRAKASAKGKAQAKGASKVKRPRAGAEDFGSEYMSDDCSDGPGFPDRGGPQLRLLVPWSGSPPCAAEAPFARHGHLYELDPLYTCQRSGSVKFTACGRRFGLPSG